MIQIKSKIGSVAPEILTNKGTLKIEDYKAEFSKGVIEFEFDANIYGHKDVKDKLIELQAYKCCFCESSIGHTSYGDVEHFRPKAGWVQDTEPLNKPGYYWLAYEWDNLLLSCQKCNQRHKKNYFPIFNGHERALNHNQDVTIEQPMFIHPVFENPELHIEFNEDEPISLSERGEATIKKLRLDRDLLNEQRKKKFNQIKLIYKLAKGIPETDVALKSEARMALQRLNADAQKDETEYASMLRCFFKKYPVNF